MLHRRDSDSVMVFLMGFKLVICRLSGFEFRDVRPERLDLQARFG
jgi:hypothetical protein